MRIILASQSPARRKALDLLGIKYTISPSNIDEKSIAHRNPEVRARLIAEAKAQTIAKEHPDAIIIAGDLFVVCNNKLYEKPKDKQEAATMLKELSGRKMQVIAGVSVCNAQTGKCISAVDSYFPTFRTLDEKEIEVYVNRFPVCDFAAGFNAEGEQLFATESEGCFPFFYGLPLVSLIKLLRENGINV